MTKPRPIILFAQRRVNPIARRVAKYLPGEAVLETIGRRSGLPRQTPVGGKLDGSTFWLVTEFGRHSQYVRNLEANPMVRLQIGGYWHPGTAVVLDDDAPRRRLKQLPWLNSALVRLVGTELLTVRIALDCAFAS